MIFPFVSCCLGQVLTGATLYFASVILKKHETECVQILGKDSRNDTGVIGRTCIDLLHGVSRRCFALDTYRTIF